jgi:hypothetical protein
MFLKNICNAFVIELVSNLDRYVDPAVTSLSCNVVDSLADLAIILEYVKCHVIYICEMLVFMKFSIVAMSMSSGHIVIHGYLLFLNR